MVVFFVKVQTTKNVHWENVPSKINIWSIKTYIINYSYIFKIEIKFDRGELNLTIAPMKWNLSEIATKRLIITHIPQIHSNYIEIIHFKT